MKHLKTFEGLFDFFKKKGPVETNPEKIEIHKLCKKYKIQNYKIWFNEKTGKYTVNVSGPVDLSMQKLTQIPITFGVVNGFFDCSLNNLTDLTNAPFRSGHGFSCKNQYGNTLTSLKGAPKEVEYIFDCSNNDNLISYEYGPEIVGGTINLSYTNMTSLDNLPDNIHSIWFYGTPLALLFSYANLDSNDVIHDTEVFDLFREYDPIHPASTDTIDLPLVGTTLKNNKPILYVERFVGFLQALEDENLNTTISLLSGGQECNVRSKLKQFYNLID